MHEKLLRTFLSVPVPTRVKSIKHMFYSSMKENPGVINWVRDPQLHLTLNFLGHTPESTVNSIIEAVEKKVTCQFDPMDLSIAGTGCFPVSTRPRTLWLGVEGDLKPLISMVNLLRQCLDTLGFPFEDREYFPHITLARIRYPQKFTPNIDLFLKSSYDAIVFPVDRVQFFSSELLPNGAVYTLLKSFPLGETL